MKNVLYVILRVALGLVFIYASYHKILRPDEFADAIYNYKILPAFLVNLLALTLPYAELVFGLFLVFNFRVSSAALAINLMMLVFIVAIFSAWIRGIDTSCGCFSNGGEKLSWMEIIRDFAFLGMGIYVFIIALGREKHRGMVHAG